MMTTLGTFNIVLYSNHLNTKHLKYENLIFQSLSSTVFRWSDNLIGRTIIKPDILHHESVTFVRFSDHRSNTRLFDNQTCLDHWYTGLVRYSDGYCILCETSVLGVGVKCPFYVRQSQNSQDVT